MSHHVVDTDLAEVVWWGTHALRARAHVARGVARCPTRLVPYGTADPAGRQLNDRCREDGCLGIVHAVYLATVIRMPDRSAGSGEGAVARWVPYARRVVASQVAELDRSGRVARGLPAKPTRTDGVPGRVIKALRHTGIDPVRGEWLEHLFRMMRSYVCRDNRRAVQWPTDMWAAEKSVVDGRFRSVGAPAARREIAQDVAEVLRVAVDVAGAPWVAATILDPFRGIVGPLPDDLDSTCPIDDSDPAELAMITLFRTSYAAARRRGYAADTAFRAASLAVFAREPEMIPVEVIADLEAVLADGQPPLESDQRIAR